MRHSKSTNAFQSKTAFQPHVANAKYRQSHQEPAHFHGNFAELHNVDV